MQETQGGRHENIVERCRSRNLGQLDIVGLDAVDGGGSIDVVLAEPGTGGEYLAVSQVCECGGRICFCSAVAMAGKDVETKHCFCSLGEGKEESKV